MWWEIKKFHQNSAGLYLLFKVKKNQGNSIVAYTNKRLLALLSSSELTHGIFSMVIFISKIRPIDVDAFDVVDYISITSSGVAYSAVMLITLNRLLSAVYPFKYQHSMTKKKFIIMVVLGVAVMTSLCVAFSIIAWRARSIQSPKFITFRVLDHILYIYLLFCAFTYVVIFTTILKSRQNSQTNDANNTNVTVTWKQIKNFLKTNRYTIPFLITLSFTLLVATPDVIEMGFLISNSGESTLRSFWKVYDVTWPLNNLSDAVIYVLCDRDIRNHLRNMFISQPDYKNNIHTVSTAVWITKLWICD